MPSHWGAEQIGKMHYGAEEIDKAYVWNGTGWDLVFESFVPYEFYTNFDSLSAGRLITVQPNTWYDSPANSIVPTVQSGGTVRTNSTTTDGTYSTWCVHSTPANSDNFEVEVRMAEGWNGWVSGLLVGSNQAMTDFALLQFTTASGGQAAFVSQNLGFQGSTSYSGVTGASNDLFTFRKTVVSGVATYRGFKNGVQFVQHVDTGVLPANSAAHRYGGMCFTFRRATFTNAFSPAFTDFRIRDIQV